MYIAFFSSDPRLPSPAEQFLISRYGQNLNSDFSEEIKPIGAIWRHSLETRGTPDGQHIGTYKEYSFFNIKIKKSKVVIRFPFYRDLTNDRLVILLGYYKIVPYNPGGSVDRHVHRELEKAQLYYNEYKADNSKLETPQIIKNILSN